MTSKFRGDLLNSGNTDVIGTVSNHTSWVNSLSLSSTGIQSSVCVGNENIYFGSMAGTIYCLDQSSGSLKWSFETLGSIRSSPSLSLDHTEVYVGSDDNTLYALSAATGSVLWRAATSSSIFSSPVIFQDNIIISSGNTIYSIRAFANFEYNAGGK